MKKGIYGKKLGMTQVYDENGLVVPVTVVQVEPLTVTQVKTVETDGYTAIQVGTVACKEKSLTKAYPVSSGRLYADLISNEVRS